MKSKRTAKPQQRDVGPTPYPWRDGGDGLVVDVTGKPVAKLAEHDEAGAALPEAARNRLLVLNAPRLYTHCLEALKLLNDGEPEAARNVLDYASELVDRRPVQNR